MDSSARTLMSARRELHSANTPAPTLPAAMSAAAEMASSWWGLLLSPHSNLMPHANVFVAGT